MDNRVMEKHTDLAIEVGESFPEDSVEIDGVCLEKHTLAGGELLVLKISMGQNKWENRLEIILRWSFNPWKHRRRSKKKYIKF